MVWGMANRRPARDRPGAPGSWSVQSAPKCGSRIHTWNACGRFLRPEPTGQERLGLEASSAERPARLTGGMPPFDAPSAGCPFGACVECVDCDTGGLSKFRGESVLIDSLSVLIRRNLLSSSAAVLP